MSSAPAAAGSRRRRPPAALLLLCGCVASPVDEGPDLAGEARPVVLALEGDAGRGEDPALTEYYRGVLQNLHDAYAGGDLPGMRRYLAAGVPAAAPSWMRERFQGFAALAEGLAFEQHCRQRATLAAPDPLPPPGQPLQLVLRIPPGPAPGFVLGGARDPHPVSFRVRFVVADEFPDGSSGGNDSDATLRLPEPVRLSGSSPSGAEQPGLVLPVQLELEAVGVVRRTVTAEIGLLPGYVESDGVQSPVRRTPLGRSRVVQYPAGHEAIRARPLDTLREAMRRGDPGHFPHVWLAAMFAPEADREAALEALIGWVRIGSADQQTVAMAALKAVTGARPAVGDRQAWLGWWQERR